MNPTVTEECAAPETFARFASDELPADERAALLDHAAGCASCHAAIAMVLSEGKTDDNAAPSPQRLGRYTLGRVLGRGAMGVVHVAHDPELGRDVAVKLLRARAAPARLRREAQSLAKLAHPNVVRVYDAGEADGQTFIAMELVDGENLRQWLASPRTRDEIVGVLVAAGRGLGAAHRAGLVHRDFKPDNVLIARDGNVMVSDFGLARTVDAPASQDDPKPIATAAESATVAPSETLTATGTILGTPAYMAPEQAVGEATPASDQYAFCVTAWEALFGARPFAGTTLDEVRANARLGRIVRPDGTELPRRIEDALRRGLSGPPEARFPSIDALVAAIAPEAPRRRRWPWLVAGGVLAGGATAAALVIARGDDARVRCADTAQLVAAAWSPATEQALVDRFDRVTADAFARYAGAWQVARVEACRATHERREQTTDGLARRVACLDRARDALRVTIAALLASNKDASRRSDAAASTLPSLAPCEAMPEAPAALPAATADSIAAVDAELTALDIGLASDRPTLTLPAATALRQRADALAYPPQRLRARLLEARVAAWTGDRNVAAIQLRDTIVLAEQTRDDFTRARAGAALAVVIAARDPEEATRVVTSARAALERAGRDPRIERELLDAEVRIAAAGDDFVTAVELQSRIVASLEAESTDPRAELIYAYDRLASMYGQGYDERGHVAASAKALELNHALAARNGETPVAELDPAGVIAMLEAGDLTGAAALARRYIAIARSRPDMPAEVTAFLYGQLGLAYEVDFAWTEGLAAYREAVAAWSLPPERYGTGGPPDVVELSVRRIDSLLGVAMCLWHLSRYADQLAELDKAHALIEAGGDKTADLRDSVDRWRGIALVELGKPREARTLLAPIVTAFTPDAQPQPFPRGVARFALARALWLDGGQADRSRARALADDAVRDFAEAIATADKSPSLRKLPSLAQRASADVSAWLDAHPLAR
jgi:predicted Ser/Thr protein kinase